MKNFKNKVVVVTGAASGMGEAYAKEFARLGSHLAICDVDLDQLNRVEQELKLIGNEVNIYSQKVDVSVKQEVFDFAENVKKHLGNTHVIINNAGIEGGVAPLYNLELDQIERVMNINFWGVVYGTKAFLPQIVANNEGAVVNVSSIFGLIGTPNSGDYCASKFAVRGFTEVLMAEFVESPISIHCVHPGGIATNIIRKDEGRDFHDKYLTTPPEKIAKHVVKSIKAKRSKIVYGSNSLKVWLGSNFVPQDIMNKLIWHELKKTFDLSSYKSFMKRK